MVMDCLALNGSGKSDYRNYKKLRDIHTLAERGLALEALVRPGGGGVGGLVPPPGGVLSPYQVQTEPGTQAPWDNPHHRATCQRTTRSTRAVSCAKSEHAPPVQFTGCGTGCGTYKLSVVFT